MIGVYHSQGWAAKGRSVGAVSAPAGSATGNFLYVMGLRHIHVGFENLDLKPGGGRRHGLHKVAQAGATLTHAQFQVAFGEQGGANEVDDGHATNRCVRHSCDGLVRLAEAVAKT